MIFCVRADGICARCLLSVHVQYSILFFAKEKHKQKHFIRIIAIYTQSLFIVKNLRNLQSRSASMKKKEMCLWFLGIWFRGGPGSAGLWLDSVVLELFSSFNESLSLLLLPAFCSTKTCFCLSSLFRLLHPIPSCMPCLSQHSAGLHLPNWGGAELSSTEPSAVGLDAVDTKIHS